ncbi:hypothetical protein [Winogradskyella thalassocola]|uniref:Lipocalin-like domain-containing protein n=1 Tax=Winogradskyella thalassocola TaxID=262004 RepID=A0A1G8ITT8_9FLAO|nr:hypothetical protein [Winogradskyella thalassocola]SDI22475.1 hypothetical protein SAMN04489796_10881 [Winogradskyella thalassocola]
MINKIPVLYSLIVLTLLVSCDNETFEGKSMVDNNSCQLAMQSSATALENLNSATTTSFSLLCQVYKDALQYQIDVCGDTNSILQLTINSLGDCAVSDGLCEEATASSQLAQNSYNSANSSNFEELCNAYKNALNNQIEVCGDNGSLQIIIDSLGDCELSTVETTGSWKLVNWNTDLFRDINNDGIETGFYLDEIDCYNNETITFNPDGTGTFFFRSKANITYTPVEGSDTDVDFSVECIEISEDNSFNWIQIGNSVNITMLDGEIINYFRNGNSLFVAFNDGFFAASTVEGGPNISERVTYVYVKL